MISDSYRPTTMPSKVKTLENLFVSVMSVLLVLSILTSLVNIIVIFKLRIFSKHPLIEFTAEDEVMFNGKIRFDEVFLSKNEIQNVSQLIGNVTLQVGSSFLSINSEGITIKANEGLKVFSSSSGKLIFPPNFSEVTLSPISSLTALTGLKGVHKIRSPIDQDLSVHSENRLKISGTEGLQMDSKNVDLEASSITLSSSNGSILFEAEHGIVLNPSKFPVSLLSEGAILKDEELQYKLCICGRSGRLFKVKLTSPDQGCSDVRFPESINPCS